MFRLIASSATGSLGRTRIELELELELDSFRP